MQISSLDQTTSDRITIHFDDGSEVKSTLAVITDLRLYVGKNVDFDEYSKIKHLSCRYTVLNKAADLLSRRLMSKKELRDKLILKGYDEDTVKYCVEKMENLGLINDEYYANAIVNHYIQKSYGIVRIKNELQRRGISRDLWDSVLANIPDSELKIENYIESHLKDPTDQKQVKKVTDSLYRRGFSWEEIKSALRNYEQ